MSISVDSRLVQLMQGAYKILIFTGAGVSTESGIPDYRGPQGVWKNRKPVYYQDFMSSEASRLEYWDFYLESWSAYRNARPNPTHSACVKLLQADKLNMVVTQNIDGLHARAGLPDENLIEIHGTNRVVKCQTCGKCFDPDPCLEFFKNQRKAPICDCAGLLKPATISFGQSLDESQLQRAFGSSARADLVIALGSTLSVHPAASIPLIAAQKGVPYVIVNKGPTDHDNLHCVHLRLEGDVSEIFPAAVEAGCI